MDAGSGHFASWLFRCCVFIRKDEHEHDGEHEEDDGKALESGASDSRAARGAGRNTGRLRVSPLVEFEQNKTCSATRPDFITPVVNDDVEILLERRNYHPLGHGAKAGLKEMRTTD